MPSIRAVWYTKSRRDDAPRGRVHATLDEEVTLCGKRLVADGMWYFGGWPETDHGYGITCGACLKKTPARPDADSPC